MRYLLFILLFIPALSYTQEVLSGFHGYVDVVQSQSTATPGKFDLRVNFTGGYYKDGRFLANEVQNDDYVWIDYAIYRVDTIYYTSHPTIIMQVYDSTLTKPRPAVGQRGALFRPTAQRALVRTMRQVAGESGLSANQFNGLINHLISQLDEQITSVVTFDGNRPIVRVPEAGDNLGTSGILDWLEWWYQGPPTISFTLTPSTTVYEVGTSTEIILSATTSNPSGATLSNGELLRTSPSAVTLKGFGALTSVEDTIQFIPTKDSTAHYKQFAYSFRVDQDWVSGAESGTVSSTTRSINAVYPVLYGTSATDSLGVSSGDPYTAFTKLVQTEGNKTVTFNNASPEYLYYLIPTTWTDQNLSSILDHNLFETLPSWKTYNVTVTSSGLVNNWSYTYKVYQLKTTTTTSNYAYQFKR